MDWSRWLLGVAVVAATVLPPAIGARALGARLVPGWPRVPRLLGEVTLTLSAIVVLGLTLGTLHVLAPVALLVGGPAAGLALTALSRRLPEVAAVAPSPPGRSSRIELALAVVAVVGLLAQSLGSVAELFNRGIYEVDSLQYHLAYAADFAKTGSTTGIAYVGTGATPYHPANVELLHGLGLVAFRVEVLSLVLNVLAAAIALLAAGALGARVGRAASAVAVMGAVLSLPMLGRDQAGNLFNDVFGIAFATACAALLVWCIELDDDRAPALPYVLPGLAGGLAVGTKLTTLGVVALLALAALVVIARRAHPLPRAGAFSAGALLTGGYWALRNLIATGNPVPAVDLGVGPVRLARPRMPLLEVVDQNVLEYLGDSDIVSEWFIPGLRYALGPWPYVVLVLVVVAAVATIVSAETAVRRLLGVAGLLALLAYFVTPTTAGGTEGFPILFAVNVRYAAPALCLLATGVLLTPIGRRLAPWWAGGWVVIALLTLSTPESWAAHAHRAGAWITAGVLVAVLGGAAASWPRLAPRRRGAVVAAVAVACVWAGGLAAHDYVEHRYREPAYDRGRLVALGRYVGGARTGVAGMTLLGSYYGPDLDGHVELIADVVDDHEVRPPTTCRRWRERLRERDLDAVVVFRRFPRDDDVDRWIHWTRSVPGVRLVMANSAGAAFRLPQEVTTEGCA